MALTIEQLANQPEVQFIDVDPVSGKNRYYNSKTGLYSLSNNPPTADQQAYHDAQQEDITTITPPSEPLSNDSAVGQINNTTSAPQSNEGTISPQEIKNLNATNTADNPDAGEAIQKRIQNEADAELGVGKVEVGPVIFVQNTETPNAANNSASGTTINVKPIPNRLKEYSSYIYGLSLHVLTDKQYNQVIEQQTYTPANVLIASAGRYSSSFPRNEFFNEDFYFDDCNIATVIAPNDVSRNTNAIQLDFTLIEPYGFTLVERILRLADALKCKNYLDMPYLLQIDFFALDDSGNIVGSINDLRKRIPIKIIKFDIRVGTKGTEYKIKAVPYNHSAYDATTVTTPANFEITASSVAEFFQSAADAEQFSTILAAQNAAAQRQDEQPNAPTPVASGNNPVVSRINAAASATGPRGRGAPPLVIPNSTNAPRNAGKNPPPSKKIYTTVKSYGSAINDWYRALNENRKTGSVANTPIRSDTYKFVFLPDPETGEDVIGGAQFIQQLVVTPKETPMKSNSNNNITDQVNMRRADLGVVDSNTGIYDSTKALFQVQYGTTIEKLLEYVIRNSDYIQRQLIVPESPDYDSQKEKFKNEPLNWFKIVPVIRLLDFDDRKKLWSREIIYTVQPYKIFNVRLDVGPQGVQLYPVKNYDYIYTGKNDDVFDFDINFNALYYNQVTAYRDSLSDLNPSASSYTADYQVQNAPNYSGGEPPKSIDYNAVMPMVVKPIVQNSKAQATGGANTAKEVASVDLADSLMTNSQADMQSVKLKILGDPDYIKQDDVFYRPNIEGKNISDKPVGDPRLLPNNGSLVMDSGEIYVQLLFRTPIDIDETTGLMRFDSNYKHSVFSGLYKVLKITSHFSNGQFTQDLELVRLPRQTAFDYVSNNQNNKSSNRDESSQPKQPGLSPPNPNPIPSTLVSGGSTPASPADLADTDTDQTAGGDQPVSQIENADPNVESQSQADLRAVKDNASTETINDNNQSPATSDFGAKSSTLTKLPNGVTQDPVTGNYKYKGMVLPADNPDDLNRYVTAVDNKQTIQVTQVDNVSGNPITRTFNGDYTQAAVERAQNNVTFAEKELARLENKINTDPEFKNLNAEQQTNLDVALARRRAEVSSAKSTLEQAKAGKYTE